MALRDSVSSQEAAGGGLLTAAAPSAGVNESLVIDTAVSDTISVLVIEPEPRLQLPARTSSGGFATSWLLLGLLALFAVIAIRYRKNSKYISAIFREVTNVRARGNMLDNTVREVSFMLLLNILWAISAGILIYAGIGRGTLDTDGAGLCVLCALAYEIAMTAAYSITGRVFSDATRTRLWVRGFWAAQSLSVLVFFPIAVILTCYPGNASWAVMAGIIGYILVKILFIWKGYRIFFAQISSWVLFL